LAEWVIAMDDGTKHVFGVLSDVSTGNASRSGDIHGPGRAAGNSINTLLDAWIATDDDRFLRKLEQLIRRTIHPDDDIEALDLGHAEWRWSYTVYLQALVRFLELSRGNTELLDLRAYCRMALVRYAEWMAINERFYLDEPEKLEYPTETWAAQELRKGTTLWMVARFVPPQARKRLHQKGAELLDRAWQSLMAFDSRLCTRPVAIVLQQGYLETSLTANADAEDGLARCTELGPVDFGSVSTFVEQRQHIRDLLTSPSKWAGSLSHLVRPSRWLNVARQTWLWERFRWWSDNF
jgi:hypothetical protein